MQINLIQIAEYLFCRAVDFERWLYYIFNGNAPRRIIFDPQEEILPHRRIGTVFWNFVENHGISGLLYITVTIIFLHIVTWGKGPAADIKKAKGGLKFREIVMWYLGVPATIIGFIWGIIIQIKFFINGRFG